MNAAALRKLMEHRALFAQAVRQLTDALVAEGFPEDVALKEARTAALTVALGEDDGESWRDG